MLGWGYSHRKFSHKKFECILRACFNKCIFLHDLPSALLSEVPLLFDPPDEGISVVTKETN